MSAPLLSISLSLLVAILELGSSARTSAEEDALQSLVSPLEHISVSAHEVEVREMSSHALSTIIARRASASEVKSRKSDGQSEATLEEVSFLVMESSS